MDNLPLEQLGLAEKWPKLSRLRADLARFEAHHRKAVAEAARLEALLPQARGQDIDAEAAAVRRGKRPPEPAHEPEVRRELERAESATFSPEPSRACKKNSATSSRSISGSSTRTCSPPAPR